MGPSASSRSSEKSRANTSTVNTRAWRVRRVESASWCGSWPWAVRMMKLSTPASSQDPSRSFIQRCSVLRRTEALPGKGRLVAVLTPYSIVGARRISSAPDRSSARRSSLRLVAPAAVALTCLIVGATLVRGVLQVQRIECSWPEVRAGRLPRDSSALKGTLAAAVAEARRLAERGMTAALLPRQAAFERVRDAVRSGSRTPGVERGVVILAPNGEAVAWAGRHRFVPARDTAELRAVITPFYVSLEARRQTLDGGSAVGSVLLDAVPAAPDRGRAVSAQFEAAYGVALRFYTPGLAPREPDVFDYCPISCERGDTLFSVQPVPPSQGDAKLAALRGTTQRGGPALAVALVLLALVAPAGRWRWLVVLAAAWCAARAPLGSSLRTAELFSPAAFYRPVLGVFSASAGSLIAAGVVALCAASALWPRGLARGRWAVLGIATVAGTAAALVTWGAAVEGRLGLAERDAQGLGRAPDPRAVSLLEHLGTAPPAPPPRTPGELYAWWLASPLAIDDYPASLAVWTRAGEPQGEIRLASVDLPSSLVAALVRSPETARGPRVERLDRSPGVHYILVLPLGGAGADVLTVGVGPRTRLIPAARVARFLQGAPRVQPPYHLTLSPPAPPPAAASARVIWTRTGWSARGERRLELPDGVHHVHLTVDLREPWALLVRGVLVVVVDAGVLAACWIVSLLLAGAWRPRLPPIITALRTSYRVRLAAALSAFVVLPVLLFAVWSFARLDDERVQQQQEDLALVLIFATLAGLVVAVYLAGLAARGLARPVAALRDAAGAVGRGAPLPSFPPGAPREFEPVISAFERMAADVTRSQGALEEARRRTAQVLANVATGVIALDDGLRVTMANPRAAELLGAALTPGDLLPRAAPAEWLVVWNAVREFLDGTTEGIVEREFAVGGRQIRVQLAPLGPAPDGCVVALDDATALTRAARGLAWGEMARQVAHEIKNPLTPIRLGIQHLQRAREKKDGRDFDATLAETAGRILAEIDRLDAIARAFSRFASPAAEALPLEPVDVHAVAREVVHLYTLGGAEAGARVEIAGVAGPPVRARRDAG